RTNEFDESLRSRCGHKTLVNLSTGVKIAHGFQRHMVLGRIIPTKEYLTGQYQDQYSLSNIFVPYLIAISLPGNRINVACIPFHTLHADERIRAKIQLIRAADRLMPLLIRNVRKLEEAIVQRKRLLR
ncbi:hypothetical protein X801_05498, partial [Opisthorchis viverrini]